MLKNVIFKQTKFMAVFMSILNFSKKIGNFLNGSTLHEHVNDNMDECQDNNKICNLFSRLRQQQQN